MNRFKWLMVLLIFSFSNVAKAQKPQMPTLNYLTINLTNGNPTIYWTPPPLGIPLIPDPTGYIIYKRITDALSPLGRNEPIDTVLPGITSYTDFSSSGNAERLTYLIASNGPTEPSQLTSLHSNIFITPKYDTCNNRIILEWELYKGWDNSKIYDYYYLYYGNTSNWATFALKDSINKFKGNYILNNVGENQLHYFYITAKRNDAPFITFSNLAFFDTKMPKHPSSMLVDSIIAEDKRVNIYFKIDPTTKLTDFRVIRWENSDSIKSIFSKKELYKFNDPTKTYYIDSSDSWTARTRPFYYKIDALNTCPKVVKITNHANSITPKVYSSGMINTIQWDKLFIDTVRENNGNYVRYRVIRYAYTTVPLPPVYLPDTDQIEITDDVHSFEGQGYSIQFCYQIEGNEVNLAGDTVMLSRSRIQCTEIVPGVIMPDAINPADYSHPNAITGSNRNTLTPIITFKANYTLSIYNRWGNLIFNGENEGWNGHLSGGQLAKEGAYIYRLVVHTIGDRDVIKTGNVTVVYQ